MKGLGQATDAYASYNKTFSHFESSAVLSRTKELHASPLETDSVGGLGGGLSNCTVVSDHRRLCHRILSATPREASLHFMAMGGVKGCRSKDLVLRGMAEWTPVERQAEQSQKGDCCNQQA